jgi:hypothetical protein
MGSTKLREDSDLPTEGWSDWTRAMVPKSPSRFGKKDFKRRLGKSPGFMCITDMKDVFDEYKCGIYEWKAVGTKGRQETKVVYVGSTCTRGKSSVLKDRIMEYCNNGSYKSKLIDDALEKGYELWVRVKATGGSRVNAEGLENDLLSKYNYAWNKRRNGDRTRNVLPE